ncbi:MAG: DUF3658 domain-containing protein [Caulobacter sp.]|nr:DUF3658 domain-containing protein [Caulobacter sp.]
MTLHITFSEAGADVLREALRLAGRDARVISLPDDLSMGPVGPADPDRRPAWFRDQGIGGSEPFGDVEGFWREALAHGPRRVVWTNRRVAREYAGFLEWLSRNGAGAFALVDLTHRQTPGGGKAMLGIAEPGDVVASGWLEAARPLSAPARRELMDLWARLTTDPAPLRLVRDGVLVPALVSAFDEVLMAATSRYWTRLVLIVGKVLGEETRRGEHNASLGLLEARVRALVEAGRLEAEGEVRLADGGCLIRRP